MLPKIQLNLKKKKKKKKKKTLIQNNFRFIGSGGGGFTGPTPEREHSERSEGE